METVNKVIINGYLGSDPQLRILTSGQYMCLISVATHRKHNDKTITDWHKVVIYGDAAEQASYELDKGDLVYFSGYLTYRRVGDKTYANIVATEYELVQKRNTARQEQMQQTQQEEQQKTKEDKDDIPF